MEVKVIFTREEIVGIRERARSLSNSRNPASRQWHQWERLADACTLLLECWQETPDEEMRRK